MYHTTTSPKLQSYLQQMISDDPSDVVNVIVQKQDSSQAAEQIVTENGGIVTHRLEMINAFAATLPVDVLAKLAPLSSVNWLSLDGPVFRLSDASSDLLIVRDAFDGTAFNGSNGDPLWTSDWVEVGEADGAVTGDVALTDFFGGALRGLRLQGTQRGLARSFRLGDVSAATLTITYRRKDFVSEQDQVFIELSSDGGATWNVIDALSGPANDPAVESRSYSIAAFASENLAIRISTAATFSADARFYVDMLEIEASPTPNLPTILHKTFLPLINSGEGLPVDQALVEAANTINTTNLASTYVRAIRAEQLWNTSAYLQGTNVTVAVVDSGISPKIDLNGSTSTSRIRQVVRFGAVSNSPDDDYGHGTHIAGVIAGNGTLSGGVYIGVAPKASLIDVKVTNDHGAGSTSDIVAGLQWIYQNRTTHNIKVVNLSLNSSVAESYHTSALNAALEMLWFNGIVVVVSAGNSGGGSMYPPANDPFVITVGAMDDKGSSSTADDTLPTYSAFGVTGDGFVKPDIVAPGHNLVSLLASDDTNLVLSKPASRTNAPNGTAHMKMSGTSMASAVVAGAVALLLQDEPTLTPDQVKYRLMNTARPLGMSGNCASGAGYLDIYAAVTGASTQSANTGIAASQLLWTGSEPIAWNSVNWNSVNWNSVNWNSVNWNSVNWNSVNWNSVNWNSTSGNGNSSGKGPGCNGGLSGMAISHVTLINADTDKDILSIADGMVIDLATQSTGNFNVRANTRGTVESVKLELDSTNPRVENSAPYALNSNTGDNYAGAPLTVGDHRLTVTPYTLDNTAGSSGTALTVEFKVIDSRNNTRFASTLVAKHSGRCVDVPGAGTANQLQLQQHACNTTDAQNFEFQQVAGKYNTYMIVNRGNGKCLDVPSSSTSNNAPINQYSCHGGPNQQFALRPVDNTPNLFYIIAINSGKCLDITGASLNDGAKLQQYSCGGTGSLHQQWTIEGFFTNNLLLNGGFEGQTSGWWVDSGSEGLTTDSASGVSALNMIGAATGGDQRISVVPGKAYNLTVSHKSNDSGWSGFGISYYDKFDRVIARTRSYSVAPSNAVYALVWFWKDSADGYYYVDQVAVEEAATPANRCSVTLDSNLISVNFANETSKSVKLNWLDANCNETTYATLPAWADIWQETYKGHGWRIRDAVTNAVISDYTTTAQWQEIKINQ